MDWARSLHQIRIVHASIFGDEYLRFRILNEFEPMNDVAIMVLPSATPQIAHAGSEANWWPLESGSDEYRILLNLVVEACAEAWGMPCSSLQFGFDELGEVRTVGVRNGSIEVEIPGRNLFLIRRP